MCLKFAPKRNFVHRTQNRFGGKVLAAQLSEHARVAARFRGSVSGRLWVVAHFVRGVNTGNELSAVRFFALRRELDLVELSS